jgi:nitrous oxide reductase
MRKQPRAGFPAHNQRRKPQMSQNNKKTTVGRRDFLKLSGVAAAAGGTALAVGNDEAEASAVPDGASTGYRETDHVKTYYKLASF